MITDMTRRKIIIISICCALLLGTAILLWKMYASPTRIAFVNYQAITLGQISKANDNSFIKIEELPTDRLDKASDYDMVMVFGMGLRLTDEQRRELVKAAESGTPADNSRSHQSTELHSVGGFAGCRVSQAIPCRRPDKLPEHATVHPQVHRR